MSKFYQSIQRYGPSFMTKFCSALSLENLLTNIFAKLNLRGGVSCMPAALLFALVISCSDVNNARERESVFQKCVSATYGHVLIFHSMAFVMVL